jgi:hypothetical protein
MHKGTMVWNDTERPEGGSSRKTESGTKESMSPVQVYARSDESLVPPLVNISGQVSLLFLICLLFTQAGQ